MRTSVTYFVGESVFNFVVIRDAACKALGTMRLTAFFGAHPDNETPELPHELRSTYIIDCDETNYEANHVVLLNAGEAAWQEFRRNGHETCTGKWCNVAHEPNSRCPRNTL